jgi:hemerythrin-like domain-containing protein
MNAIQLLKSEHDKARQMFAQIEQASADRRGRLWATLKPELTIHEQMEETALYGPVAAEIGSSDQVLQEWNEHHHDEVGELEALIGELGGLDPSGAPWMEKLQELQLTLEHHIEEEEGEIWPRIEQAWDESKLEHAGQQMETLKRQKLQQAA